MGSFVTLPLPILQIVKLSPRKANPASTTNHLLLLWQYLILKSQACLEVHWLTLAGTVNLLRHPTPNLWPLLQMLVSQRGLGQICLVIRFLLSGEGRKGYLELWMSDEPKS